MSLSRDQREEACTKMHNDLYNCRKMGEYLSIMVNFLDDAGDDSFRLSGEVKLARKQVVELMGSMAFVEALLMPAKIVPKLQTFEDLDWIYAGNDALKLKHYTEAIDSARRLADQQDEPKRSRMHASIDRLISKLEE